MWTNRQINTAMMFLMTWRSKAQHCFNKFGTVLLILQWTSSDAKITAASISVFRKWNHLASLKFCQQELHPSVTRVALIFTMAKLEHFQLPIVNCCGAHSQEDAWSSVCGNRRKQNNPETMWLSFSIFSPSFPSFQTKHWSTFCHAQLCVSRCSLISVLMSLFSSFECDFGAALRCPSPLEMNGRRS